MGLLIDILTFPVLGPIRGTRWIGAKVAEQADHEMYDPERVQSELMELEMRYELGEIGEAAFEAAERDLLVRLEAIRQAAGER